MKDIKSFKNVRDMTDKELGDWLEKIWKTGYRVSQVGGKIEDCPKFYIKLKSE